MTPVFVVLGTVLLVGTTLALLKEPEAGGAQSSSPQQSDGIEAGAKGDPFADLRGTKLDPSASRKTLADLAPQGLMEKEPFRSARALADEGQRLADRAIEAQKKGDLDTFRDLGREARAKLEEATAQTTDWWLELDMKYPGDRQVEAISKVRSRWDRSLRPLRGIR